MGLAGGAIGEARKIDTEKLQRQRAAFAEKRATWQVGNRYPAKVAQVAEVEGALAALAAADNKRNRDRALDAILALHGSDRGKLAEALR